MTASEQPGNCETQGRGETFSAGVTGNPWPPRGHRRGSGPPASAHTRTAVQTLVTVMQSGESDNARVAAANALLHLGYGKSRTDQTGIRACSLASVATAAHLDMAAYAVTAGAGLPP
jgi:hypothetical protein